MWKFLCPIFLPNTVHGFALQKTIPIHLVWFVQKRDREISVGRKRVVVLNQGSAAVFSTGADSVFPLLFKKLLGNFCPSENSTTHRASGSRQTRGRNPGIRDEVRTPGGFSVSVVSMASYMFSG